MTKVWIIHSGDYSDYRVDGIFSTRENAERVREALGLGREGGIFARTYTIAERELDPGVAAVHDGYRAFEVWMRQDGTVERVRPWTVEEEILDSRCDVIDNGLDPRYYLDAIVYARDEPHAIKIVNEKRAELIALGVWDTGTGGNG